MEVLRFKIFLPKPFLISIVTLFLNTFIYSFLYEFLLKRTFFLKQWKSQLALTFFLFEEKSANTFSNLY